MPLDAEQRQFFDDLDTFTEQTFVSRQYAGPVLRALRRWRAEGRPVHVDAISQWAREREHEEWEAGALSGLALAVELDDDSEAHL